MTNLEKLHAKKEIQYRTIDSRKAPGFQDWIESLKNEGKIIVKGWSAPEKNGYYVQDEAGNEYFLPRDENGKTNPDVWEFAPAGSVEEAFQANARWWEQHGCGPDHPWTFGISPKTKFVNTTPHSITIFNKDGVAVEEFAPAISVRVEELKTSAGWVGGYDLVAVRYKEVAGLPEPEPGIVYIVSKMVQDALPDRMDLVRPGELVRDGQGNIIGCKNFFI